MKKKILIFIILVIFIIISFAFLYLFNFIPHRKYTNKDFGIYYDPQKKGVDFLLNTISGDIIPIEVGIGKKDKKLTFSVKEN